MGNLFLVIPTILALTVSGGWEVQDDPALDLREWIERLDDADPDKREQAMQQLLPAARRLGAEARRILEREKTDGNAEVRIRIEKVLRILEVDDLLGAEWVRKNPGLSPALLGSGKEVLKAAACLRKHFETAEKRRSDLSKDLLGKIHSSIKKLAQKPAKGKIAELMKALTDESEVIRASGEDALVQVLGEGSRSWIPSAAKNLWDATREADRRRGRVHFARRYVLPLLGDREAAAARELWFWPSSGTGLSASLQRYLKDFDWETKSAVKGSPWWAQKTVVVRKEGKQILSFPAHGFTPLARAENILLVAEFQSHSSGCAVSAYDLVTGEKVWNTALRGLGPIAHSKYGNRVCMEILNGFLVVLGHESAGRYIEVLSPKTGESVSQAILEKKW